VSNRNYDTGCGPRKPKHNQDFARESVTAPDPGGGAFSSQQEFFSTGDGIDHPPRPDRSQHLVRGVLDPRSFGGVLTESDERHRRDDNQGEDPDSDAHSVTVSKANWIDYELGPQDELLARFS
jgi:hypothetical protein